ncbi:MAG: sulfite exporter TauE/SafE family protein [Proteobacteria bacterium]|nr:sulfite exporter TauE/SafE family protein [Pseudomonadota bacterium]
MLLGYPVNELAWLALLIIAGGVVTGFLAGLFGVGGGGVIVPILYEVFRFMHVPEDLRMQVCVGTSLAIIVPTTLRSYAVHKSKGAVIPGVLRLWTPAALAGILIGAAAASFAPAQVFKIAFVTFCALMAAKMLAGSGRWNIGTELPGRAVLSIYGFAMGALSSLVGVSGGGFSTAILTLYGQPIHRAVATSAGLGVPITVAGTIGYIVAGWPHMAELPPLSLGFVSIPGFVLMAPVASFMTTYGVRLAHWLPRRALEVAFACFLILVGTRFLISLF